MTGTESPSESRLDHAYFQALEEAFVRVRGAPLLLSPTDWQVAQAWRRRGVPLTLAIRVMEQITEKRRQAASTTGVRSLRYFDSAVSKAWLRIQEMGGGAAEAPQHEAIDVDKRLQRLAAAVPQSLEDAEVIRASILGLRGDRAEKVEARLQHLDQDLLEKLEKLLGTEKMDNIRRTAESAANRLGNRFDRDGRRSAISLLQRNQLRREFDLPVFSLFSSEARA